MRRVFGVKKDKAPAPTVEEATERLGKRGDTIDEKIKKLDVELTKYRDQLKKTRPGPAQEAIKRRAMGLLKQKKMYEGQREQLYNQTYNLDQVAFATEGMKDAQQTMQAMKAAGKEMKQQLKVMNINDVDTLQDDMMDMMDMHNEFQEALGRSYGVPDELDEEELMGELEALELDMESETGSSVPSYLAPEAEPDLHLPSAPHSRPTPQAQAAEDDFGLPNAPSASLRN